MTRPLPPLPPIPEAAPSRRPTWLARHRAPLIVSVTALAAIGAGVGVAFAAAGDSSTTQGAASTSTTPPASGAAGGTSSSTGHTTARARKGTRATIVSETASTWTVRTRAGQSLVVTITPQTHFGTVKAPATRAQFTPGESVVILGTVSNGTVTATRIAVPAPGTARAVPSPAPTTS